MLPSAVSEGSSLCFHGTPRRQRLEPSLTTEGSNASSALRLADICGRLQVTCRLINLLTFIVRSASDRAGARPYNRSYGTERVRRRCGAGYRS